MVLVVRVGAAFRTGAAVAARTGTAIAILYLPSVFAWYRRETYGSPSACVWPRLEVVTGGKIFAGLAVERGVGAHHAVGVDDEEAGERLSRGVGRSPRRAGAVVVDRASGGRARAAGRDRWRRAQRGMLRHAPRR